VRVRARLQLGDRLHHRGGRLPHRQRDRLGRAHARRPGRGRAVAHGGPDRGRRARRAGHVGRAALPAAHVLAAGAPRLGGVHAPPAARGAVIASIASSSSPVNAGPSTQATLSSSWATLLAPISTLVTRGSRSVHDSAIWASVCPRSWAIAFSLPASSVSIWSALRNRLVAARESAGTPFR